MKTTKKDLETIASFATSAARENACETVRENHPASEGRGDMHPAFDGYFRATLEGILDDSLRNPRTCGDYGASKPLTDRQIAIVTKLALG